MELKKLITILTFIGAIALVITLLSVVAEILDSDEPTPYTHEEYCENIEYKPLGC